MAQLIEIQRVEVGLEYLTARVRVADGAPLMTSDDLQATTRIYNLMPHIIDHVCLGDAGETFRECMGATEIAHLLEHMTVELLAQTNIAGDITSGKTYSVADDPRAFDVQLSCRDDVLTVGALSSAIWVADWAFSGGGDPQPDIEAIVEGLCGLVASLGEGPQNRYAREVEDGIEAAMDERYNAALSERQREIEARLQEIEAARAAAEAEAAEILAREAEERAREEARRAEEEARRAEEERRVREQARRAEEERQAREAEERAREEARRAEEETHRAEEERRAREQARRAEEERLIAETRHAAEVAAERAEAERAAREAEERAREEARRAEEEARRAEEEHCAREAAAKEAEERAAREAEERAREEARRAEEEARRAEEEHRAEDEQSASEASELSAMFASLPTMEPFVASEQLSLDMGLSADETPAEGETVENPGAEESVAGGGLADDDVESEGEPGAETEEESGDEGDSDSGDESEPEHVEHIPGPRRVR